MLQHALANFGTDRGGNIPIIFAFILVVVVGVVGFAVDYGDEVMMMSRLQTAADAAAIDAVTNAKNYIASQSSQSASVMDSAKAQAESSAAKYFSANQLGAATGGGSPHVTLQFNGSRISAIVSYRMNRSSIFGGLLSPRSVALSVSSLAESGLPPYINVYLLVDTSGSMALGASANDQNFLIANNNCAFACHDGNPVHGYPDAYAYALGSGLTLRYTAVNNGILALLNEIDTIDPGHQFVSTAVYDFNNTLNVDSALTNNTSSARSNLPAAPATSGTTAGATHFNEMIGQVVSDIGHGGDGSSPANAIKLLIIATDGAEDPGRYWVSNIPARAAVAPFDMSFCGPMQFDGVLVGIIHTPYLPMTWDWGYNATLGQPSQIGGPATRADDIAPVLQACAGTRYVLADNTAAIVSGFTTIFKSMESTRLTQ